ncbi:hypothetical protein AB0J86_36615 [Micromonospora sp. NPDC049559]|uniref:hypothetical protein n=1 Tax=Micromonospora sp. NPDC049559 TaxID=3155923 RepID=UPI003439F660
MDPAASDDRRWRLRHLPVLLGVSGVALVVAAVLGGLLAGGVGAVGAPIGVAIVTLSYTLSTLVIAWADSVNPQLVLAVGLAAYATKFTLLGVIMSVVASSGWAGLVPLCLGVAAGVVLWTGTHIWWISTVHARRVRGGEMSR